MNQPVAQISSPAAKTVSRASTRMQASNEPTASRLISVDIFRGLCVAAMVLVTNAGSWSYIYWPLKHADWNGTTPTDMIFPSFLFLAGVSMTFSFAARERRGQGTAEIARHIAFRSLALIVLGVALNCFDLLSLADLRIPGVLQRIGLCYCFGGLVYLAVRNREGTVRGGILIGSIAGLVILYWLLQTLVPVPGYGAGRLDSVGTLSAYLDRAIFTTRHLWHWGGPGQLWDPEGLLSTMPSIGNLLLGILTGEWLRARPVTGRKVLAMIVLGGVLMLVAVALNPLIPINKKIWTPSFFLFSGGFSLATLGLLYSAIDKGTEAARARWQQIGMPAKVFGSNAILGFSLSYALNAMIGTLKLPGENGQTVPPNTFVYDHLIGWLSPWNASLAYATLFVVLIFLLLWPLHIRRIFLRL